MTSPCALAGACLGAALVAAQPGGTGLVGLLLGWLYGLVVGTLLRLFRVPSAAYPLVGLISGPLPFAVLMPAEASQDARGLIWVGMLAGLVLGCVEWARARWLAARESFPGPVRSEE
jgi:hypothetical protein